MEPKKGVLGTFAGVFTPSALTILGIILFLRLGYVVGNAGFARALVIIGLANVISVLTSFSLAAIATNLKVKGGGDYYLISRTLGLEFGGAIGLVLFLAQSVSIAFYCIGFGEATASMLSSDLTFFSPRPIAVCAVAFLFIFAWMGADWATKFQYGVMTLLVAALLSFFIGGIPDWHPDRLVQNWSAPAGAPGLWILFAIFFPAVTGFTQGVSMSGDLKNPGKSLPLGTFSAVGISILVYFGVAAVFAGVLPNEVLAGDYYAMKKVSRWSLLIDLGVIAATLSSAMASFLGAPRILQSLSADRIFPFLLAFAKISGAGGNPRRGVLLSAGIAFLTIALGNLNLIAPVVSMFFLISYGLLNYATYYEARTESPSFRPRFKWFDRRLSLIGFLACLAVMLAIDLKTGVVAISILFGIFQYLRRTAGPTRWADSRRAHHLQRAREHLLAAAAEPEHPRDWRPMILTFSGDPKRRARLLAAAAWLEGQSGMTTIVSIVEAAGGAALKERAEAEAEMIRDLKDNQSSAFPMVLATPDFEAGVYALLQTAGTGPLKINTILMNWLNPESKASLGFREYLFGRQLRTVHRLQCSIAVLYTDEKRWQELNDRPADTHCIDVWWQADASSRLMLLFAYLLTRSRPWMDAAVRVIAVAQNLQDYLDEVRIDAEPIKVKQLDADTIEASSQSSSLVFLPFRLKGNLITGPVPGRVEELLKRLPTTLLVMAAEDIDLDAEPEEGTAGEMAAVIDAVSDSEKKARIAEKDLEKACEQAESIKLKVTELEMKLPEDQDPDTLAKLKAEAMTADEMLEKARRRAAKARAKADDAVEQAEKAGLE